MDDLELMRRIERDWPHVKIVFLTGHSEFEYARSAISPCVAAYVLKLEGDKKILEAVDRARAAVDEAFQEKSRRLAMESDLRLARPLMQAECLRQMIRGGRCEDEDAFARQLEAAGVSINRYIVSQRISLAQSLLMDPSLKISEIVARTGLNTPSYFTYYFKKHMGLTPQEYRSQLGHV